LLSIVGVVASSAFAALLFFGAFVGAGLLVTEAAGFALLAEATEEHGRARVFALSFASVSLAAFAANVVGGSLAAPVAGWLGVAQSDPVALRALLAIAAGIGATGALPVLLLSTRERPPHVAAPRSWPLLLRFGAVNLCFGFGAGSFLPFLNLFFNERFGLDFASVGLAIGIVSVGGGLGGIVHAWLGRRLGVVRSLVTLWALSLPFGLLGAFASSAAVAVVSLVGRGVLMTAAVPAMDAFRMTAFPARERSAAQVVVTTTWAVAYGAGALVSGQVRAALGPPGFTVNLLTLVAAYVLAIAIFALAFARQPVKSGA